MKRLKIQDILVVLLLLLSIVIRANRLDIVFDPEDTHLDYLAGHQLVRYGEIPLSGSGNPVLIDSPLYYYIVSVFVALYDNLLFLSIANFVIIQPLFFIILYGLAATLFNRWAGVIAVTLAVTSFEYVAMGGYFFQTNVMQVFANASFLFLALAARKKQRKFQYVSVAMMAIAMAIHHSTLSLLPLFTVILALTIPHESRVNGLIRLGIFWALLLIVFHIPILLLFAIEPSVPVRILGTISSGHVVSIAEFIQKFFLNLMQFFYAFSLRWSEGIVQWNSLFGVVLAGSLYRYMRYASQKDRYSVGFIALFILQLVIFASFLRVGVWNFTFTSLAGLYIIGVSAAIHHWWTGLWYHKAIGVGALFVCLYVFSNAFVFLKPPSEPRLNRWKITKQSTKAIGDAVQEIALLEKYQDFSFFQIQRVHHRPEGGFFVDVYSQSGIQIIDDLLYWPALQTSLGGRFVRMERDGSFPTILNGDTYVFVICDSTRAPFVGSEDCLKRYIADRPGYRFIRHIYAKDPITIELVRRDDIASF